MCLQLKYKIYIKLIPKYLFSTFKILPIYETFINSVVSKERFPDKAPICRFVLLARAYILNL